MLRLWTAGTHIHKHDHWLFHLLKVFRCNVSAIGGDLRTVERKWCDDNCADDDGMFIREENVTGKKLFLDLAAT